MSFVLKQQITDAMKAAMKGGDKARLGVIRLMLAAIKQREVDERIELDDSQVLAVLDKMVKQRRESIKQYSDAGRDELAAVEAAEIEVIQQFLPEELSDAEIAAIIEAAIAESGAGSIRDMGKVMAIVKPKVQGRADVGKVSGLVKAKLG
ncbi:MAG: GatB/YqeY domain-containing protein [Chromatiaceae bacterium]|nr:GatB/YqeY domain-containing protein [Gammaproteobacteria bacterium]MCP5313152.1 GatB/YqeY domain-containing protein [Chromatiaceae bacterium]